MKKIMSAALGLALLSGTAVFAAQNTATSSDSTMKSTTKTKHSKHHKKSTADTTSTTKQ